jgi:hypothetical protein
MLGIFFDPIALDRDGSYDPPVVRYDANELVLGNPDEACANALRPEASSFREWLEAWLEDRLEFRPPFVRNSLLAGE